MASSRSRPSGGAATASDDGRRLAHELRSCAPVGARVKSPCRSSNCPSCVKDSRSGGPEFTAEKPPVAAEDVVLRKLSVMCEWKTGLTEIGKQVLRMLSPGNLGVKPNGDKVRCPNHWAMDR